MIPWAFFWNLFSRVAFEASPFGQMACGLAAFSGIFWAARHGPLQAVSWWFGWIGLAFVLQIAAGLHATR